MIRFDGVSKTFKPNSEFPIKAIQTLSFEIPKGQYLILMGSNGSGKSTLLNLISGEILPDEGLIFFENQPVQKKSENERARWISHIFQNPLSGTASELSILDNFRLASLRTQSKGLRFGITEKFKKKVQEKVSLLNLGLENKLTQSMGSLSGGQRQALTLVMAIMDEPKILLMDEPTAALDIKSAGIVLNMAEKIIREYGLTAIMITHNLKEGIRYGDRIIQIRDGKIQRDLLKKEYPNLEIQDLYNWMEVDQSN